MHQQIFALLEEKGVSGLFPEAKRKLCEEDRRKYKESLRRLVFRALDAKPDATVAEILLHALPELPPQIAPFYLVDLIHCAEKILQEKLVTAWRAESTQTFV